MKTNSKTLISLALVAAGLIIVTFTGRFFLAAISTTNVNVLEITSVCNNNSQCGADGLTGILFCQSNNVYKNYITYTCNNPGTESSSCSSSTTAQLQTTCAAGLVCSGDSCTVAGGGNQNIGLGWYYPTVIALTTPLPSPLPLPLSSPVILLPTPTVAQPIIEPVIPPINIQPTALNCSPIKIADLSKKIPSFKNILNNLNINLSDAAASLKDYNIFLPGLKEITGANVLSADFSQLTPAQKNKIPKEVVFVLLGDKNIDALTKLDFSDNATSLQMVNVLPNKPMRLVVEPEPGVKEVSGYVLFKPSDLSGVEQEFSVLKFNYNINKDGLYLADINSPATEGNYQIVTSIKYDGKTACQKDIKTTTLVDPEGYIYEQIGGKELRIINAKISLYKLNNENQYELWTANQFGQENPQITGSTGKYSFLVPEGIYYLTVQAPNYYFYQSDALSVKEGKEIHSNIALKRQFTLYSFFDWTIIAIIILFLLVAYNFYRDWRKGKNGISHKN